MTVGGTTRAGESRRRTVKRMTVAIAFSLVILAIFESADASADITNPGALGVAGAIARDTGEVQSTTSFVAQPAASTAGRATTVHPPFPIHGSEYGILATGAAAAADQPNSAPNTGTDLGGGNVRGNTDRDVTILRIDLTVPAGRNCLSFDFRFLSEEFPEFVGQAFNDAFIAELDASTWTTSGSTITAPDNFAFDSSGAEISVNSSTGVSAENAAGTTYDGATPVLRAVTPVTPGPHAVFLSIFDQQDAIFDSAAFVDDLRSFATSECTEGADAHPVAVDDTGDRERGLRGQRDRRAGQRHRRRQRPQVGRLGHPARQRHRRDHRRRHAASPTRPTPTTATTCPTPRPTTSPTPSPPAAPRRRSR